MGIESQPVRFIYRGRWPRIAEVHDEVWLAEPAFPTPKEALAAFRTRGGRADLLSFGERVPQTTPRANAPHVWEQHAVITLDDYEAWWAALPHATQGNIRKAERSGVSTRPVRIDEAFARSVKAIYDETPIRHGKRFRHYGEDLATVLTGLVSYPDRSLTLGAYVADELVGFAKIVQVGCADRIMHLLSLARCAPLRVANALVAAAVRHSAARSLRYLLYDRYAYPGGPDSLTEFKRRNGFRPVQVPRYYFPLTPAGRLALTLGFHLPARAYLPTPVVSAGRRMRALLLRAATPPAGAGRE